MIRVIEPGTKQIAICNDCGCKFSYEKEDVQTSMLDFRSNTQFEYVICPQCHRQYKTRSVR